MSDARTDRIDDAVSAGVELLGFLSRQGPITPGQARLVIEAAVRAVVPNAKDWEVRESATRIADELEAEGGKRGNNYSVG
jgi:hypothetical protein